MLDNDPLVTLTASDVSVTEFGFTPQTATIEVQLDQPTINTVSVDWSTADGTATAGADYTAAGGCRHLPTW